jgi:metal-responsive CopG/Arc/MetJ family transcriptional regulator
MHGTANMKRRKVAANTVKSQSEASSVRATISFPSDVYATLDEIAKQKKVSLAWVVREAAEKYLADKWLLLKGQG